ncbi:MAG: VOC family protein [Betaproteobacteria bacterium]|nr:VOC family protein [Betaproteobacteria bacterium]
MSVHAIPEGYRSVTPYLGVRGAAEAIEHYKRALGAVELFRLSTPTGGVGHAELMVGDSRIMLADERPEGVLRSPLTLGGTAIGLHVYVEDVDARFARAIEAGAKVISPVKDQFYGDRTGTLEDPFGHVWTLATHKEDLSPEEIAKRAEAFFKPGGE